MRVGFIGLGTMGSRMAGNILAAGHQLVVHDLNPAAGEPLLERGATWAVSPAAVAGQVDVVFTSLPGPPQVEAVALSLNGIIGGALPGLGYFDLSTNSPTVMRRIHAEMIPRGVHVFDAPVSGGPDGAASGRLAIWAGGDPEAFEAFLPVLRSFSDAPHLVGPVGAGSIAKLVHNCSGYILQTALAETFTLGVKAGVEPEALWEAVRTGALGRRRTFDTLSRNFLPGRFDPPDFALELARKDVALACELAREYDVPMRLANLTLMEMTEAMNRGWARRDSRSAMLLQEERAGVEVRVPAERIAEIVDGGRRQPDPVAEAERSQSWFERTIGRMRGKAAAPMPATESSPSHATSIPTRDHVKPPSLLDQATAQPVSEKPPSLLDGNTDGAPAPGYYLAPGHIEPVKPPSILDEQQRPVEPVKPPSLLDGDQPIGLDAELGLLPGSSAPAAAAAAPAATGEPVKPPSIIDELLDELIDSPLPGATPSSTAGHALNGADAGPAPADTTTAPAADSSAVDSPAADGTAATVGAVPDGLTPDGAAPHSAANGNGNGVGPVEAAAASVMIFPADPAATTGPLPVVDPTVPLSGSPAGAMANTAVAAVVDAPMMTTAVADPPDSAVTITAATTAPVAPSPWHYGWVVVGTVFIILMVTSGLGFYNASVILNFAVKELGASLGEVSGGPATFFGISGIVGFLLARRMENIDLRWFYLAGGLLGGAALFSLRWVHSIVALYLFFAVYGVAFALCGLVPGITLITRWFQLRRSIAISITSTGLSLGGIALTPVAKSLIKTHQLGGAGPIMAAIWVVGVIPLAMLFIRSRPADKGLAADGIPLEAVPAGQTAAPINIAGATFDQARRTRFFVMLCVAYALIFFSQVGGLAHLFKLATDRVDDGTGSLALALLAATSVAGRLMGGVVVLRVPTKVFSMILVALQAMALLAIALADSRWSVLASAVFLGVSVGNLLMLQPLLLAEAFGVKEYSRIYGLNQLVSTIGVAGGPLVLGFVHDATSYTTAFVVAAIGSVLGFVAFLAAGPITGPLRLWTDTPAPVPAAVPAVIPAVAAPAPGAVLPVNPLVAAAD